MKNIIRRITRKILIKLVPEVRILFNKLTDKSFDYGYIRSEAINSKIAVNAKLYPPFHIYDSEIESYTYISINSRVSKVKIGRFCSIGPNFLCGWGIHPIGGISTSPMFYSTMRQNGTTMSDSDKIKERKEITIGDDVFIGANVTVLDGVSIGTGAVIGAGAVVSKDIPPYAIAVGCPIRIIKYRFDEKTIDKLLKIQWWNWNEEKLKEVEEYFFDVATFCEKYYNNVDK